MLPKPVPLVVDNFMRTCTVCCQLLPMNVDLGSDKEVDAIVTEEENLSFAQGGRNFHRTVVCVKAAI